MKIRVFAISMLLIAPAISVRAQPAIQPYPTQNPNPLTNISIELTAISRSVQSLNARLKDFVDKFEKVGGLSLTEKQQRLILGLELLVRSEQRVATLQKSQIELIEKQAAIRTRLAQVDRDLRPQSIDRSVVFEGTTQTEELRENKRQALQAEQASLQGLLQQIQGNLNETGGALREAQSLVFRLRRTLLPQIEREVFIEQ